MYRAAADLAQGVHVEGLPLGTRGGFKISHNFPLDGEYEFDVFLVRNIVGYMTGLEWAHELEIAIDGERVFLAQVGGEADNARSDENMSAAANEIDARLRTRTFVTAGPHDVTVAFLERSAAETHEPLELHTRNLDLQDMNGLPIVDYVQFARAVQRRGARQYAEPRAHFHVPPGRRRDRTRLCCGDSLDARAPRVSPRADGAGRARRCCRSMTRARHAAGSTPAYESALRVILTSPKFLFRDEPDPAGVAPGSLYALDDAALASRLAFFIWSAPPDDELLERRGARRAQRAARVRAADRPHARRSARGGARRELRGPVAVSAQPCSSVTPDVEEFPNFDDNLRHAMRRETELLFDERDARGSTGRRAPHSRLHVRQRAAREALRHAGHLRQPLPPGARRRRTRAAGCSATRAS